jgi:hypothetical protein
MENSEVLRFMRFWREMMLLRAFHNLMEEGDWFDGLKDKDSKYDDL